MTNTPQSDSASPDTAEHPTEWCVRCQQATCAMCKVTCDCQRRRAAYARERAEFAYWLRP